MLLAVCLFSLPSPATTLLRLNLEELARAADAIALARCVQNTSYAAQGNIWTRSEFELIEPLKGAPPRRIRVILPGGRAGHILVSVEAVPRFRPGEEAVLFLQALERGDYTVTGWAEGSFRIHRNERTGERTVTQDSSATATFDPTTRRYVSGGIRKLPLTELRRRVAAAIRNTKAR